MCNPIFATLFVVGLIAAGLAVFDARFRIFFKLFRSTLGLGPKAVGFLLKSGLFGWILLAIVAGGIAWYVVENPDSFRDALSCVGIET